MTTVIIPTFKRAASLRRAIKSVLYQDISGVEIIVVDDNEDKHYRTAAKASIKNYIKNKYNT